MISALGIDVVTVARFNQWHTYSHNKLLKIFSLQEIEYCLQNKILSAQRFAVRFAAREALFKAFTTITQKKISFFSMCTASSITITALGVPVLIIDWIKLANELDCNKNFNLHISLSHTNELAFAQIILEEVNLNKSNF